MVIFHVLRVSRVFSCQVGYSDPTLVLHCHCGKLIYFDKNEQHSIKERTEQNRLNETVSDNFSLHNLPVAPESVKSRASEIACKVSFVEATFHSAGAHEGRPY